jgi:hypothetical protein
MDISLEHPDLYKLAPLYKMIDDVLRGEEYIKRARHTYLPYTSGMVSMREMILSKESNISMTAVGTLYEDYLDRAQFPSWTEETMLVMAGLITQVVPTVNLPEDIKYILEDATSDGFSLTELFQRACYQCVRYNKVTLVTDIDKNGKAYISMYDAYSEYNWAEDSVNGRKDLVMCAFKEHVKAPNTSVFSHQTVLQRRAYILQDSEKGPVPHVYQSQSNSTESELVSSYLGMQSRPINYLPIVRISAINSLSGESTPPLLPIARCSLKAYVLSADLYSSMHRSCHPQLYVTGVESSPIKQSYANSQTGTNNLPKNKQLGYTGAGTVWTLPLNSTAGYIEAQGTGIDKVSKDIDKQRTTALQAGAKVMDIGVESGDARNARQNDQYATLFSIIKNCAKGIEQAIRYAFDMTSASEDKKTELSIQFEVPSDFGRDTIDATLAAHLLSAAERGAISFETYYTYVTTGKAPERSYDQEQEVAKGENITLKPITGMVQVATGKDNTLPKDAKAPANPSGESE